MRDMDIASLRERMEKLTGPDREADWLIGEALDGWERKWSESTGDHRGGWYMRTGDNSFSHHTIAELPAYTASIDAAIALAEKALPAWQVIGISTSWTGGYPVSKERDRQPAKAWLRRGVHSYIEATAEAPTPAIALCLAILAARLAQHEDAGT